ncbi:MAG: tRNA pseudouridine(55) synthase TruB [Gemmatimonadales bacterium]|nr:MAG: tRNA pseudouridine(55) synthase TruB [Gemmatimonadales bacterium]
MTGLLPVDKPAGPTSHDIVAQVRRALGIRRVGHAGTLDPFASGLLLVCVGSTTRLVEYLHDLDKCYEAEALLGVTTDSDDLDGEVVARSPRWEQVDEAAVTRALESQLGNRLQQPPVFSAKKVHGEAAHRKARRGESVDLAAVPVMIHEVELLSFELPSVRFRVRCGTGTYIRAIARDLGESLGCGAHLTSLRRTSIGPFQVDEALPGDDLAARADVSEHLLSPMEAVRHLPVMEIDDDMERRLRMGQRVELPGEDADVAAEGRATSMAEAVAGGDLDGGGVVHAIVRGSLLVGVGTMEGDRLRPRKILPLEDEV